MNETTMKTLRSCGLAGAYSALVRPVGAVILMYHSVAGADAAEWIDPASRTAPAEFERQMEFLAARRAVVSMHSVAQAVRGRVELPTGAVAITFDDGYLDTLTHAAPVLARLKLPATLFLPTAYIDSAEPQWIDRAYTAFRSRTSHRLDLPGVLDEPADVSSQFTLGRAYARLCGALLSAGKSDRSEILERVEGQLRPTARPDRTTMNWDDAARLRRQYPLFSIGGHTLTHRDLSACNAREAGDEITGCLERIEAVIGERPVHFSFPYGRSSEVSRHAARAAGLEVAVASGSVPRARPGSDPFRLSRIAAPSSVGALAAFTHPAYPDLPLTLTGHL